MVWVIVTVWHGDADKVYIEHCDTKIEMMTRVKDLEMMIKEVTDELDDHGNRVYRIVDENRVDDAESSIMNVYWWNITVKDELRHELLITIDAKEI